jgi:hypothetical protein
MQVDLLSRSPGDAKTATAVKLPEHLILITGCHSGELDEPQNLIRQAAKSIRSCKPTEQGRTKATLKGIGLLLAASLRAKEIGGWSSARLYDPLPEFIDLRMLATKFLGPVLSENDQIALFRDCIDGIIRDFLEVTAAQRIGA